MKKITFFLILSGLFLIVPGCTKTESSDPPPEAKDPSAKFSYTIKSNGIVSFSNTSENATSYLWDFGDETTSTTSDVTFDHQYFKNGTYKALLTAYGNGKSSGGYANLIITSVVGNVPTVETNLITGVTKTSATSGGNVTSDGGSSVTARGVCWSTVQNPTINDNKTIDGSGTGSFTSDITGLSANTPYYVRAYATNSSGTGYGNQVNFTTSSVGFSIGQIYGGGIIFYIDGTGQHGLIAATTDQSTGAKWGCDGTSIPGTSTAIGTGQANTTIIVNGCSEAGIAARICDDLGLNGYSDWFLPSKDELNQMYLQKSIIGGFLIYPIYWSSSEYSVTNTWDQYFWDGLQSGGTKGNTCFVRAVRAF
jgi:hypothetical protein